MMVEQWTHKKVVEKWTHKKVVEQMAGNMVDSKELVEVVQLAGQQL